MVQNQIFPDFPDFIFWIVTEESYTRSRVFFEIGAREHFLKKMQSSIRVRVRRHVIDSSGPIPLPIPFHDFIFWIVAEESYTRSRVFF